MKNQQDILKNLYEYLKNDSELSQIADVGIRQPQTNQLNKGYVVISAIEDTLVGVYSCNDEMKGVKIGLTIYEGDSKNISKINKINDTVYKLISDYKLDFANHRIVKHSFPRWNDAVMMWMCVLIYTFYFDENS
jgi:hypothetical protein